MSDFLNVGPFGGINKTRIVAIAPADSAPIKRAVRSARTNAQLIDLTYGQASKWAVFMDSGHLVLCPAGLDIFNDTISQTKET